MIRLSLEVLFAGLHHRLKREFTACLKYEKRQVRAYVASIVKRCTSSTAAAASLIASTISIITSTMANRGNVP